MMRTGRCGHSCPCARPATKRAQASTQDANRVAQGRKSSKHKRRIVGSLDRNAPFTRQKLGTGMAAGLDALNTLRLKKSATSRGTFLAFAHCRAGRDNCRGDHPCKQLSPV